MPPSLKFLGTAAIVALLAGPASAAGMSYSVHRWVQSPAENNAWSARYDYLLQVNPYFRSYRMRKECGPINFSRELRHECFGSFDQYEPVIRGW
ncbi:MAG TPA: hypothetical protein VHY35_11710 [Stellaceae bacterium]|jgi:hypothetical protein|nr:hypothetical protein [Stellaceae bacterium]